MCYKSGFVRFYNRFRYYRPWSFTIRFVNLHHIQLDKMIGTFQPYVQESHHLWPSISIPVSGVDNSWKLGIQPHLGYRCIPPLEITHFFMTLSCTEAMQRAEMCSERDSPLKCLYWRTHAKLARLAGSLFESLAASSRYIMMEVLWVIIQVCSTPICMVQCTHLITTGGDTPPV